MTEICSLTLAQAGRLIGARELSPIEYVEALLARIATLDPVYHAFITVTDDIARAEAKAAEAEIARGNRRGPMHGIPYAMKDVFDVADLATTCHSKLRADHRATEDATVVRRLRDVGASCSASSSCTSSPMAARRSSCRGRQRVIHGMSIGILVVPRAAAAPRPRSASRRRRSAPIPAARCAIRQPAAA